MADEDSGRLNRRSVLAGIGAAGAGAALGGFGTSALFTDEEHLDDNEIVAGELDLFIDWQEKYDKGDGLKLIDVFPADEKGGKEQADLEIDDFCKTFGELGPPLHSKRRSIIDYDDDREVTKGNETDGTEPLVQLDDVKPGDRWETTFSYHLCGNDGWVWFRTKNKRYEDEDANNKPENHLADKATARVWYDMDDGDDAEPGDNVYQPGKEPIIAQGTLREVLDELNDGVLLDADPAIAPTNGDNDGFECIELDKIDNEDDTELEVGREYTFEDGDEEITVTITGLRLKDEDENGEVVGFDWMSDTPICQIDMVGGPPGDTRTQENVYDCEMSGTAFTSFGAGRDGEKRFGVSNFTFYYCDIDEKNDEENGPTCTEASTTRYIGFEWQLPLDVGNEIQRDRLEFDLGFYTEQCRHNDDPQNPFVDEEFPNNPWLADAQTPKGGVFWNNPEDDFALQEGDEFGELPSQGQPLYANPTDQTVTVSDSDGTSATSTFDLEPYDGNPLGEGPGEWYRIPTGAGTPMPDQGDFRLVSIEETADGFDVVWEPVE
ncbi:SipW-dependent-type signal peptide-containing protein [Natranaeroarchaeum sulfidigenes]|uniref:Secreted protein containing bacterial Ig-like domain and vWFA domain, possible component of type IV pili like system n=1 Tax=Natranaeroarchaeum sulfidigenes TaxID=2784880 RepID=A0A897MNY4_9EURY|nr:SipW-dependent-type signal peptide-containing protein [Natranaeroarchaeum sulfidigenes]QSG03880.1 Secreted protein containing bacterial Ig-like domain and vWFA domain, possible component of type IV pili like system [Natranaeroarchaeum sulfidigenes]